MKMEEVSNDESNMLVEDEASSTISTNLTSPKEAAVVLAKQESLTFTAVKTEPATEPATEPETETETPAVLMSSSESVATETKDGRDEDSVSAETSRNAHVSEERERESASPPTVAMMSEESSTVTAPTTAPAPAPVMSTTSEEEPKKPSPPKVTSHATNINTSSSVSSSNTNNTKKRAKNNSNNNNNNASKNVGNNSNGNGGNNAYPYPRQPWVPYAPPPYGYPGSSGPYGPPPPPHYSHPHHHPHHPPPPPHPHHMMSHPHYGGAYGGPPPPHAGAGRNGGNSNGAPSLGGQPPSYPPHPGHHPHPYAGGPPPPYGMPYGMAPYPPSMPPNNINNNCNNSSNNNSDGNSVNSNRSKGSKRTIDGVAQSNGGSSDNHVMPPSAYQFRRSDDNSSSTSTITAGNNTSMESMHHNNSDQESPGRHQRQRSGSADFYGNDDHSHHMHPHHQNQHSSSNHQHSNSNHQHSNNHHNHHHRNGNATNGSNANGHNHKSSRTGGQYHRREYSGASTASSLSVGGFSLSSCYEGPRGGAMETDAKISSKRHKSSSNRGSLIVDTGMRPDDAEQSTRFGELSMDDKRPNSTMSNSSGNDRQLFLSLSTSPINGHAADVPDVDATPISKNTAKIQAHQEKIAENAKSAGIFKAKSSAGPSLKLEASLAEQDRCSESPTPPPHGEMGVHQTDDQSQLNHHLRHQSFTPLPHLSNSGDSTVEASPSNAGFPSGIAPQLSWSIAGDTPSLGDLADWEEDNKSKTAEKVRPSSTTSAETQGMLISPQDFQMWKEEHDLVEGGPLSGTTTPLPFFIDQSTSEGRENYMRMDQSRMSQTSKKMGQHQPFHHHPHQQQQQQQHHPQHHHPHHGDPAHIHSLFVNNSGARDQGIKSNSMPPMWNKHDMPPTPLFSSSEYRDDGFTGRSPMDGDRRDMDFFASSHMYGHHGQHGHHHNDRVRNLRGRAHPGSHLPPMPLHIPPPMSSHLPMTSPMGLGKGMWSPHHPGMPPPMGSPHHMGSPLNNMAQSKRKCVPLKPPIPSKFQGDIEKASKSLVPEFTSLVNFPAHMSQKQTGNLPEGMRCCVMCGSACQCSSGNKTKKCTGKQGGGEHGLAPRSSNGQDLMGDKSGYAIIPTQNKGLCTLCDVNVWVVVTTGTEIKWCKGCKNFRPWAAFGDKGLATKCLRCRERQREKYALQKEEKEKTRMTIKTKASA